MADKWGNLTAVQMTAIQPNALTAVAAARGEKGLFNNSVPTNGMPANGFLGLTAVKLPLIPHWSFNAFTANQASCRGAPLDADQVVIGARTLTINNDKRKAITNDVFEQARATVSVEEQAAGHASIAVANAIDIIDALIAAQYTNTPAGNVVNAGGTGSSHSVAYADMLSLKAKMDSIGIPDDGGRFVAFSPLQIASLLADEDTALLLSQGANRANSPVTSGVVGFLAGIRVVQTTNIVDSGAVMNNVAGYYSGNPAGRNTFEWGVLDVESVVRSAGMGQGGMIVPGIPGLAIVQEFSSTRGGPAWSMFFTAGTAVRDVNMLFNLRTQD